MRVLASAEEPRVAATQSTNWRACSIGETGRYINGLAFKPTDWGEQGLPIIRIQNLTDPEKPMNRTTRNVDPMYLVEHGDLLVSWSATLDAFIWDREPALLNQHIFKVVPNTDLVSKKYLFYSLRRAIREMVASEHLHGSTMKHINRGPFLAHVIPVPALAQQEEIVAEIEKQFSRLDEAVANLKRVKANLKRYKAAVLKAAVAGRLVPTEAEIASREARSYDTARESLKRFQHAAREAGLSLRPNSKDDDDAAPHQLPDGWCWTTIDQLGAVVRGASPRPAGDPEYFGGLIPWITVGPITADDSEYLYRVPEGLTEAGRERSRYIEPQTLLLTNSGATLGVPKISLIAGCINDGVAAILGVEPPLKLYLLYFLRTRTNALRRINQGAAQPNLNTSIIKSIRVPLPPISEQSRIVEEIGRRLSLLREIEVQVHENLMRAEGNRQAMLASVFGSETVKK